MSLALDAQALPVKANAPFQLARHAPAGCTRSQMLIEIRWAQEPLMANLDISRGDVVHVDLRGAEGGEKQGKRPCLVIQNDVGNQYSPLTIVAPITDERQSKNLPVQVLVSAAELGPDGKDSVVELGHIRAIDRDQRIERKVSRVSDTTMAKVDAAIKASLGIK